MNFKLLYRRKGMTLVELMVVVAIIGLLAVAVAPLLRGASDKQRIRAAADQVTGHFNAAMAKSIGSRDGGGVWLETDSVGSGIGQAAAALSLARSRAATSGIAQITATNLAATPPSATLTTTPALSPTILPATISFLGMPTCYRMMSPTVLQMLPNCSSENTAFPALNNPLPFTLKMPPRRRMSAANPTLGGDTCIDFSASTIGAFGFTPPARIKQLGIFVTPGQPSAPARILCVVFDGVGKATTAWVATDHTATTASSWTPLELDPTTPVVLLVGNRSRIGLPVVPQPTEDNPGPNYQNPAAAWVIIDPRTSVIRTVANRAANTLEAAQRPVAEALAEDVKGTLSIGPVTTTSAR